MNATGQGPKLIEVALPLAAINAASAREKTIRSGHPSNIHQWWARRPLATARAVIWASLVDDPSAEGYRDLGGNLLLSAEAQEDERQRLFGILEQLVKWDNSHNADVLAAARAEIDRAFPAEPPPMLDPFAGGGAIPLEAQRLGLTALAGDLNPVAVLINKAMIEIPPRFAGLPPVHPGIDNRLTTWGGAHGLAADVEAYGCWMRDEAERRIGHLYPDATGPNGEKRTPIAWIWARTVESPDPSWSGHVPLVASWMLSKKPGKPRVWVEPIVDREAQTISYEVRTGSDPLHERTVKAGNGTCLATGAAIPGSSIDHEASQGRMGVAPMAVAVEGHRRREYLDVDDEQLDAIAIAASAKASIDVVKLPQGTTRGTFGGNAQGRYYGFFKFADYFSDRQLVALTTFSDLLTDVAEMVRIDARAAGMASDGARLRRGGTGAQAYADAVVTYLAIAIDKLTELSNTLVVWEPVAQCPRDIFRRQAIPMTWDFAEANPFSRSSGSFMTCLASSLKGLRSLGALYGGQAQVVQRDARAYLDATRGAVVSTDPPYYDNISYADLSDFYYVWLRRNLFDVWPDEFSTILTPKADELIANRYRTGSKEAAEAHFESGIAEFMSKLTECTRSDVPVTVYYAYKATESRDGEVRSTGWDTFLQAVIDSGLSVIATWPMRTELTAGLKTGINSLASSIVLVCRPRRANATMATRGEFVAALRSELPEALRLLQSGNIAPVDMAQSTIGPGIKVFSRYSKVVEADGTAMRVSAALSIINDVLGEVLDGEEAELDRDTRFALTWFAQHRFETGSSGDAESVAKAKNTSLQGLDESGIGEAHGGKFRLYRRDELKQPWSPAEDERFTIWEALQYLVTALERSESEAADLLHTLGGNGDRARQLAYLLYQKANDNGWAAEANAYNSLITAWPSLREGVMAAAARAAEPVAGQMF